MATLTKLVERAGNSAASGGSITGIYTVLADGDNQDDPVVDTARSILDGHIVLSRELAQRGQYPAIDIAASLSRVMNAIVSPDLQQLAREFRALSANYEANRDLVVRFVRAYAKGTEAMYDAKNRPLVEAILLANTAGMTPELAAKATDIYVNEKTGFFKKPVFDPEGAKTVLALRSKYGVPQKTLTDATRYYDTSYLAAAGVR